jgi:hypothetical protein
MWLAEILFYANDEDAAEDGDQDAELLILRFEKG